MLARRLASHSMRFLPIRPFSPRAPFVKHTSAPVAFNIRPREEDLASTPSLRSEFSTRPREEEPGSISPLRLEFATWIKPILLYGVPIGIVGFVAHKAYRKVQTIRAGIGMIMGAIVDPVIRTRRRIYGWSSSTTDCFKHIKTNGQSKLSGISEQVWDKARQAKAFGLDAMDSARTSSSSGLDYVKRMVNLSKAESKDQSNHKAGNTLRTWAQRLLGREKFRASSKTRDDTTTDDTNRR